MAKEELEPKEEVKEEKKDTDTVEVSKSQLDTILERQTKLEKDNEILKESVSKAAQENAKNKIDRDTRFKATVKLYKGVPVIGWKLTEQKHERSPLTGQIVGETIKAIYYTADGKDTGPIETIEMTRINDYATVIKTNKHNILRDITGFDGRAYDDTEVWEIAWENPAFNTYEIKEIPVIYLNDK